MNNRIIEKHINCAKLCKDLYNNPKSNTLITHKKTHTNEIYIVLQGTNKLWHWVHNMSFFLTKEDGIHTGFKRYADICKKELIDDIVNNYMDNSIYSDDIDDIDHIYFTAHSLGGSAIIILVYELLKSGYLDDYMKDIDIDIVLFGAPKSGNKIFIQKFNSIISSYPNINIYRYNVIYDLIQYYPPILTYSHITHDAIILTDDIIRIQYLLYNHSISCYIKCLTNNIQ